MRCHDLSLGAFPSVLGLRAARLAVAIGAGVVGLAAVPESALAASNGCNQINAGVFNQSVTTGGPVLPSPTVTLKFEKGEIINIAYANLDAFIFRVDGNLVFQDNTFPITGSATHTIPSNGSFVLLQYLAGLGGRPPVVGSSSFTCTPVPTPPVVPDTDDGGDDDDDGKLTGRDVDIRRRAAASFFSFDQRFNPESMPGSTADPSATGDHDHVYAFAGTGSSQSTPWPLATAYGPEASNEPVQALSASGQRQMTLGGLPVNVWARAKGSLYGGSLSLRGGSGQGLLGATIGVTPTLDIGVFGHILGGKISSAPLETEVESVIGGVGVYAMAKLPQSLRAGLAVVHGWGSHDISVAGGKGSFSSSHWTVEGSVARPFEVQKFVITPMALLTWQQVAFGAYTDSNGVNVFSAKDSSLAIAGLVDIAYPIAVGGAVVETVTPRFNVRTNFYAQRADSFNFGNGLSLESSSVTVDLSTGLALQLTNGGNVDVALGASGLAGNVRSYSLRGNLRLPLN